MVENKYLTRPIYRQVGDLPHVKDLVVVLDQEFAGAEYTYASDIITFVNEEDLVAFTLKYGHIYGK